MAEPAKTLPDIQYYCGLLGLTGVDELVDAVAHHADLLARHRAALQAVSEARAALEAAREADGRAIIEAIESGKPAPKPTTDEYETKLARATEFADRFAGPLVRSTAAVGQALDHVRDQLVDQIDDAIPGYVVAVQQAEAALNHAKAKLHEINALRSWAAEADVRHGVDAPAMVRSLGVHPRRGRTPAPSELDA